MNLFDPQPVVTAETLRMDVPDRELERSRLIVAIRRVAKGRGWSKADVRRELNLALLSRGFDPIAWSPENPR